MALEMGLCGIMLTGMLLGTCSLYWARRTDTSRRHRWGKVLFLITLVGMGAAALPAAYYETHMLTWLGLCLGLLVVGMLCDLPGTASEDEPVRSAEAES